MNQDFYKVCPECGGEYQYTAATCIDCDVPLVFPEEIARRDDRELRLVPGLVRLHAGPILEIRALASDLAREGIPYAVDRRQAREQGLLSLYVRRQDLATAKPWADGDGADDSLAAAAEPMREDRDDPAYKVCPECGGEYRPEIERCADCGALLVKPSEAADRSKDGSEGRQDDYDVYEERLAATTFPPPPRYELPASDDLVCLYCGAFFFVADLSARLDTAAIAHRIELGPFERLKTRACLYLRPMDCDAAERLMREPASEASADDRTCPACGVTVLRTAETCPACGLGFLDPEMTCPHCGAIVADWSTGCPNCGLNVRESEP